MLVFTSFQRSEIGSVILLIDRTGHNGYDWTFSKLTRWNRQTLSSRMWAHVCEVAYKRSLCRNPIHSYRPLVLLMFVSSEVKQRWIYLMGIHTSQVLKNLVNSTLTRRRPKIHSYLISLTTLILIRVLLFRPVLMSPNSYSARGTNLVSTLPWDPTNHSVRFQLIRSVTMATNVRKK